VQCSAVRVCRDCLTSAEWWRSKDANTPSSISRDDVEEDSEKGRGEPVGAEACPWLSWMFSSVLPPFEPSSCLPRCRSRSDPPATTSPGVDGAPTSTGPVHVPPPILAPMPEPGELLSTAPAPAPAPNPAKNSPSLPPTPPEGEGDVSNDAPNNPKPPPIPPPTLPPPPGDGVATPPAPPPPPTSPPPWLTSPATTSSSSRCSHHVSFNASAPVKPPHGRERRRGFWRRDLEWRIKLLWHPHRSRKRGIKSTHPHQNASAHTHALASFDCKTNWNTAAVYTPTPRVRILSRRGYRECGGVRQGCRVARQLSNPAKQQHAIAHGSHGVKGSRGGGDRTPRRRRHRCRRVEPSPPPRLAVNAVHVVVVNLLLHQPPVIAVTNAQGLRPHPHLRSHSHPYSRANVFTCKLMLYLW